jgi:hypothetical protein
MDRVLLVLVSSRFVFGCGLVLPDRETPATAVKSGNHRASSGDTMNLSMI